ncbi:MAG: ABC transporter ATP-binding protein [bacterium]|nr:ABC transporter ATP-binding protein [bacterium]
MSPKLLELCRISFRYRLTRHTYSDPVLKGINLSLDVGEVLVLTGPSGAGKSTLLRLCNRLEDPSAGKILFRGVNTADMEPQALRKEIALIPQEPYLVAGTLRDNLLLPYDRHSPGRPEESRCREAMIAVGLSAGLLDRNDESLSVGERQRVSIARVLMMAPRIILMDEPTSALDQSNWEILARTIRRINGERGIAFMVVTHLSQFAESLAGRPVVLRHGEIVNHHG